MGASAYELAVKTRTSARYQLTEQGITFNFQNFIASAKNGDDTLLQVFLDENMPIDAPDDLAQDTVLIIAAKMDI